MRWRVIWIAPHEARVKRAVLCFALLASCRSKRGDPNDLRGVFNSAASVAPTMTASASSARPHGSASGAPSLDAPVAHNRRAIVRGPCLAPSGEASHTDERRARRPSCRRAEILEHRGPDGAPRYACVFPPTGVEKRAPLPLIVFFHGQDESPGKVARETDILDLGGELDLTGDPKHRGFLVLAPQARRIQLRVGFDLGYVSPENEDVRATERFIDELAKRGWIDPRRVYAVGSGKGGEMAALWTMLRPDRVAAFATFGSDASHLKWTCPSEPPPAAVLYRACDAVTSCLDVEQWLAAREQQHAPTLAFRLNAANLTEPSCDLDASSCTKSSGEGNHYRWPKGRDRAVLEFLSRFSLDLP